MQYSIYGSSLGDRSATYETPSFKRQRSDSEYGSNTYNVSPSSTDHLAQYRNALPASNYGSSETSNPGLYPHTPSYDGMMTQRAYNTAPAWQRPQQGPVPALGISSSDPYQYMQRPGYSSTYGHLQSPQYQPRPSFSGYPAFTGYQITSSMPDSGLVSPEQQGFLAPSFQNPQQNQHMQDPYTPTGMRPGSLTQPLQAHQSNPLSQQNLPSFEDGAQPASLQYGQLASNGHVNPLQRAQHDSVQQGHASTPDDSLPLDSGLLNSSLASAYQAQQQDGEYGTSTGDNVPDYSSGQPQAYPEPHGPSSNS